MAREGTMREETLILDNVTVVPGNGGRIRRNARITIHGGLIQEVTPAARRARGAKLTRTIDGTGMIALPGIINMHAHVLTFGPRLRAEAPYPVNHVVHHLWRHLLYGTTTILSVDGYLLPSQAKAGMRHVPIKIQTTTLHTPKNVLAAKKCHLQYTLSKEQERCTVEKAVELGAVAIGQTGGALAILNMCYEQIPNAIAKRTGRTLGPEESRRLLESILGMTVDQRVYNQAKVKTVLGEMGLGGLLSPKQARDIIRAIVLPIHAVSLDAIRESAAVGKRLGIPVLASNNSITKEVLRDVSKDLGELLIALHSNHPSFETDEAIEQAKYLKSNGAVIEISTGDHLGLRRMFTSGDLSRAMVKGGLVDLLSTDHTGGYFEPILRVIEWIVQERMVPLEKAIMLSTSNPVKTIPRLAPNCGEIAPGRVADVVLVNEKRLSEVIAVVRDGELVLGPLGLNGQAGAARAACT